MTSGPQGSPQLRSFKITAAFIRRVVHEQPPVRETLYGDQSLPRFCIRVRPPTRPGAPWPAEARIRFTVGGRRRWMTIGNVRTMDLAALRDAARAALAIVDAGGDPAAQRAARKAAWTVATLWQAYRDSQEFARCTAQTRAGVTANFEVHILPRLGAEPLTAISVPMIRRLVRAITSDARTNSRKRPIGGPGVARKTVRVLSAALTWAIHEGELERHPFKGALRLEGDGVRECVITEPAQYIALFEAMDAMAAAGKLRPVIRAFFIVAALTGMRRSELQALTWTQVDLAQRRITLSISKGARLAKRGVKTEALSLPPLAAAALAEIRPAEAADDDCVFPPRYRARVIDVNGAWQKVRTAAGLPPALTLHGLRHSLGTAAVLSGLSGFEVQQLLRHRTISTSARYVHLAELVSNRLSDRATERLTAGMGDMQSSAEVLPLPRRRA
jgi:integrase